MAFAKSKNLTDEIDEAEEEALLKSDEECDVIGTKVALATISCATATLTDEDSIMNESAQLAGSVKSDTSGLDLVPPTLATLADDDSLMIEAAELADQGEVGEGISDDDTSVSDAADIENDAETDSRLQEFKNILKELEQNQYVYDKYVRLCELSHATNDLDNIRQAYNLFANVYPLSPELWLKYLGVEMSLALSPVEIQKMEQLFRRAFTDYYSTDIALEYTALATSFVNPQRIWQEVLDIYGMHCMQGREFYKRYRQFLSSEEHRISDQEQQNAYIQSFLRELKYPLHNMEESYIEFKIFHERQKEQLAQDIDWVAVDKDYFKAKEHLQKILPFEEQLQNIDAKCYSERAIVYANYIKESDKFLDENVLQTIYERMVADCCLNVDCWLTYIDFIEYRDEFGRPDEMRQWPMFQQSATDVCGRALRNCTWAEQLYIKRIQLLEQQKKTREEVQEVLESSISAGFQTAEPAVAIWLEYLTYLRRNTDWNNEDECEILRKNLNLAWTILGQQWGVLADCNCEILQFWGRLEYGPLQDPKRGKELWTTVMESIDNATKSGLWIEFAQLEMRRDIDSTTKLYRKALNSPGLDNPLVVAAAWERFERCNGSIKSLRACMKECAVFRASYRAPAQLASDGRYMKSKKLALGKGTKRKLSITAIDEASKDKQTKTPQIKRSCNIAQVKEQPEVSQKKHEVTYKEHENQEIDLAKDHLRIFLSNMDYSLNESDICDALSELKVVHINLIRSANGRSRGFGYLELESPSEVEKALAMDRRTIKGRPLYVSSVLRDKEKRQTFKYSAGLEPKKLFVKGLPHDVNKEELELLYTPFGKLTDVRLVYHKSGKFKNIAYIEFESEIAASKALMGTDQTELRGNTISVAISAPPPKTDPSSSAVNVKKLLGINVKRTTPFEQKPRMSLIPNVVRKKFTDTAATTSITQKSTNGTTSSTKTNEDFRKLLLKPN